MPDPFQDPFANEADDEVEVDLTDIKSAFDVPNDSYESYCCDFQKTTSEAGNPMFEWTFRFTGKRKADNYQKVDETAVDKEFKTFTALTPNAMWKVAEVTEALGLGAQGSVAKFKKSDAIGRMAICVMGKGKYKGKDRSQIDALEPHPAGAGTRVTPAGVPG